MNLLAYLDLQDFTKKKTKIRHLSYFLLTVQDRFRDTAGKKKNEILGFFFSVSVLIG